MKIEINNKRNLYIIIGICVLCISLLAGTLAYYNTTLFNDLTVDTITHGLDYYINYSNGQDISGVSLSMTSDYSTSAANTSITFYKTDNTYDIYGHIYLDVNEIGTNLATSAALKYTLVNNGNVVTTGSLKDSAAGDSVLVKANIPLETTEQIYTIYIWLDENDDMNYDAEGESLSLTVRCEATMKEITAATNAIEFINNLYSTSTKTSVTNNGITYNYATDVSLMNDRLGDSEVGADAGNIRYYGANPNNYIDIGDVYSTTTVIDNFEKNNIYMSAIGIETSAACYEFFDCSTNYAAIGESVYQSYADEAACLNGLEKHYKISSIDDMCGTTTKNAGDPKLYRIIGLFQDVEKSDGTTADLIKVIREDSIGEFAWDLTSDDSGYSYSNDWSNSTLNSILNGAYYSASTTTHSYVNPFTGTENINVELDLRTKGLNSSVQNRIASVKWKLGGWNTSEIYSDEMYNHERGETVYEGMPTEWPEKIALMYPSDYGYAADLSTCSSTLLYYDQGCTVTDWLSSFGNGNIVEWLLTPFSDGSDVAFVVEAGLVGDGVGVVYFGVGVRPVFHLTSDLDIVSGLGTKTEPYVIR